MARITVSTIRDKRERNQTPVLPQSCTPEGFFMWNPELYFLRTMNLHLIAVV